MEEARISEITVGGSVLRRFRQLRRLHGTTLRFSANAGWVCSARAEYTAKAESARERKEAL